MQRCARSGAAAASHGGGLQRGLMVRAHAAASGPTGLLVATRGRLSAGVRLQQLPPRGFAAGPVAALAPTWRSSSSLPRRLLHTQGPAAAAAAATDAVAAATDDGAQHADAAPEVYNAEYTPEYVNYHCVTGTLHNLQVTESDMEFWVTFVVQVVPQPGVVDDYHVYLGGTTATMAGAVMLARDAAARLHDGDQVQVGGALLLNAPNRPQLFAHSLGKLEALPPGQQVQTLDLPSLPTHVAAVAFGARVPQPPTTPPPAAAGAPYTAAPAAAPAAPAAAAAAAGGAGIGPINPPGMPAAASSPKEALWISLFQEFGTWIDQRATKTGRQPDFRKRGVPPGQQAPALWIDDYGAPAWAKAAVHLLPGAGAGGAAPAPAAAAAAAQLPAVDPATLPPFIPASALASSGVERLWVEVFVNPGNFWDNRANKLNPRAPDFKSKDKARDVALWLTSKGTPEWVAANLHHLPPPPPPRNG